MPVGIISEHYHPETFTPHMPQNRVLDPSIHPVAWVPLFNQNPYTPESVNQTLTLRRYLSSKPDNRDRQADRAGDGRCAGTTTRP